jgi:hypothetical protein
MSGGACVPEALYFLTADVSSELMGRGFAPLLTPKVGRGLVLFKKNDLIEKMIRGSYCLKSLFSL